MSTHIVTLGGGGFSSTPENPRLDDFILSLAQRRGAGGVPKVCFVPTASGDSFDYHTKFIDAFPPTRAESRSLGLFTRTIPDLRTFLLAQDVIYVGGGNTANMLAIWRVHGLPDILREAWQAGTVLCGISAGMNCWFEGCSTDSFGPLAALKDGLGFLKGSACPHFESEVGRRDSMLAFVKSGALPEGYGADENAALYFKDGALAECVASVAGQSCNRVSVTGITALKTRLLP